ncbi:MAG: hypothetical protein RL260_1101 [Pseudomonadota bacterium]
MPSFLRRIRLRLRLQASNPSQPTATATVQARGVLEDDFHHFRVQIDTASGLISGVQVESPRHPYSLCPAASVPLQELVGLPLPAHAHGLTRLVRPVEQCTHLLDLAGLVCALLRRGEARRDYDIEVPLRIDGRTQATLWRDQVVCLRWDLNGLTIASPPPYAAVELRHGMARWALSHLSPEEAEAALVLRRASVISLGKGLPLDLQIHAKPTGACFAQQPERAPVAWRQIGSTLDFTGRAEQLCADDDAWLAFEDATGRSPGSPFPAPPGPG